MLKTDNWAQFPFTVDGVQFVSKIDTTGDIYSQVKNMPTEILDNWNVSAIRSLIGKVSLLTRDEIQAELDRVNDGASQALLCLA